jgi:ubiquinone/menaquinone biosynthesis C-methylase UbiE
MWLFAKIYDWMMQGVEEGCLRDWRRDLLEEAEGRVLEIGAGTGANLPIYPEAVEELVVVEPDEHMRAGLDDKMSHRAVDEVEVVDAMAEDLPFDDEGFDTVVVTLVLCSVVDLERALGDMRRVLRPGGQMLFLEHVAAHGEPTRRKWQGRLEPVWKRVAGNCHLTRETAEAIREAGFEIDNVTREEMCNAPGIFRPTVRGVAVR